MEIKDLAGFSKPLTRLIEVISKGVGAVFASYLIRQTADARAYEIRTISAALREVSENHNLPVIYKEGEIEIWRKPNDQTLILDAKGIDERSNLRLSYQERKRQANIENVTSIAAAELIDDESITTEQPDEDWISRFFNSAQDISSEQMQNLWGRILAGEIRQPGTYSLRTLDFLRNLKTREAEVIAKVGKMALNNEDNKSFFIDAHDKQWLEKERGLVDSHIFELRELAILHPSDLYLEIFDKSTVDKHEEHIFYFGEQFLRIQRSEIKTPVRVRGWKFTTVGQELLSLLPSHIDNEYLENLGRFFVKHKGKAFIGSIVERHPDGKIGYKIIREIVD